MLSMLIKNINIFLVISIGVHLYLSNRIRSFLIYFLVFGVALSRSTIIHNMTFLLSFSHWTRSWHCFINHFIVWIFEFSIAIDQCWFSSYWAWSLLSWVVLRVLHCCVLWRGWRSHWGRSSWCAQLCSLALECRELSLLLKVKND